MAIGMLSRFMRLNTAPLRKPLKMSRTIVTRKSRSIQLIGPIIFLSLQVCNHRFFIDRFIIYYA
jgi:hypothetical protein